MRVVSPHPYRGKNKTKHKMWNQNIKITMWLLFFSVCLIKHLHVDAYVCLMCAHVYKEWIRSAAQTMGEFEKWTRHIVYIRGPMKIETVCTCWRGDKRRFACCQVDTQNLKTCVHLRKTHSTQRGSGSCHFCFPEKGIGHHHHHYFSSKRIPCIAI